MDRYELRVEGMACTGCERTVVAAAEQVADTHRVVADHGTGTVEVTAEDGTKDAVRAAIRDAGYDVPA